MAIGGKTLVQTEKNILDLAQEITHGDRQQDYDHPSVNFQKIADVFNILKPGCDFGPRDVAMFNLAQKMVRESHRPKRDNRVDIAGYAWALDVCETPQNIKD